MHHSFPLKRYSLLAGLLFCLFITAQGQDFWSNGIHFNITEDNTAEVTYMDYDYWYGEYNVYESYVGDIVIPSEVTAWVYPMYEEPYEVTLPVTGIGYSAFRNCTNLTSVTLPNTIEYISGSAFYGCSSLTGIELPSELSFIAASAFATSGLQSIEIPSSVEELGNDVFYSCENLTDVVIPEGITSLPGTFRFCTALKTVTLPNSLTTLNNTFEGCSSLETIVIPATVKWFYGNAFTNCNVLSSIKCLPMTPPTVYKENCFSSLEDYIYNNAVLYVPSESLVAYSESNVWKNFVNIFPINEGGVNPGDVDGDGEVAISDVTDLIDLILDHCSVEDNPNADVNGDGSIAIDDLVELIDFILGI